MWLYTTLCPSLFDKLVRQCGWSVARFQDWLTEALQVQLLELIKLTDHLDEQGHLCAENHVVA